MADGWLQLERKREEVRTGVVGSGVEGMSRREIVLGRLICCHVFFK
jgi:hypothetical protein